MSLVLRPRRVAQGLIAGYAALCLGTIWWVVRSDADLSYLDARDPGAWIVYPLHYQARGRPAVELRTTFVREFELVGTPTRATLAWRAFRGATVYVNGVVSDARPAEDDWRHPRRLDVAAQLRAGRNVLRVVVANNRGPPALALRLELADHRGGRRLLALTLHCLGHVHHN